MALTDLFRPKYKHSDAQVRADAVRQMGGDESELLVRIASSDKDPEVRRLAVSKIEDAEVLVDLVAKESDEKVRREAHGRASELWSRIALGTDQGARGTAIAKLSLLDDQRGLAEVVQKSDEPAVRELALSKLRDERALADLVRRGPDPATRQFALQRLTDVELLRAIAIDESRKQLGLSAVEQIDDVDALATIASKAKNKHVRARAQKRRQELVKPDGGAVPDEDKRKHAERSQLVRSVAKLAGTSEWVESHHAVTAAQEEWQRLGDGDDSALAEKFAKHCAKYFARYQSVGVRAVDAARRKVEAARREAAAEEARAAEPPPPKPSPAQVAEAPIDDEPQAPAADQERPTDPQEASTEKEPAPDSAAIREQRAKVTLARLEALCIELEELAVTDNYRVADKKIPQLARTFSGLRLPSSEARDELEERYENARRKVAIRSKELQEAEEWKRWAVLPKLEALITAAQELLEREDSGRVGRELKALQADWKAAGPGPHAKNQELWERFKERCDAVYERVKEHRKVAAAEQQENLAKKLEMCEQLELLAESTDWDETAQRIKDMQREWREIGPVPRKKSKQVWQRFRSACDRFFDRRAPVLEERLEELGENLERKQTLCEQIEKLASSEADWEEVVGELRGLREAWRGIGDVPRADYQALSRRYRAACDSVFQRREEAERAHREQVLSEVDGLIGKLDGALKEVQVDAGWDDEDVADSGDEAHVVKCSLELRSALLDVQELGDERLERGQTLISTAVESSPEAFDGTDLDPQASRRRKQRLIDRLEGLLPDSGEAANIEELSPEQVAARLREALAANALGIDGQEQQPVDEVVAEIRSAWYRIGPVPGAAGRDLAQRFERAAEQVLGAFAPPS